MTGDGRVAVGELLLPLFREREFVSQRSFALTVLSIHLDHAEREELLDHYRRSADPEVRLRAHILLLLDAGHLWATVGAVLFCSASVINRWGRRFESKSVDAVLCRPRGRRRSGLHIWAAVVIRWVVLHYPPTYSPDGNPVERV